MKLTKKDNIIYVKYDKEIDASLDDFYIEAFCFFRGETFVIGHTITHQELLDEKVDVSELSDIMGRIGHWEYKLIGKVNNSLSLLNKMGLQYHLDHIHNKSGNSRKDIKIIGNRPKKLLYPIVRLGLKDSFKK